MKEKLVGILVCTLLITTFIPSFNAQSPMKSTPVSSITETYFPQMSCPPNGVGNVQPPYSGKIFGINGWKCHTQTITDEDGNPHTVEVWCLDPQRQTNAQNQTIGGGDEFFVLVVDGMPVGLCPSHGGENRFGKNTFGTWWHHWESDDPSDNGEWDPNVWDDWEYYYDFTEKCLRVWHTKNGTRDKLVHKCTPPDTPYGLPPFHEPTPSYYNDLAVYIEEDVHPPTVSIVTPREGAIYVGGTEIPIPIPVTLIIGPITVVAEVIDGTPGIIHDESGVATVSFLVDGVVKDNKTIDDLEYEWLWDETVFFKHELEVIAADFEGNEANATMNIWIFNI